MKNKKALDHRNDEYINNLEIFIECLKEITDDFNNLSCPSIQAREEVTIINLILVF